MRVYVGSTSGFVLQYGVYRPAARPLAVISLSKVQMETQGRSKRGAKMEPRMAWRDVVVLLELLER